MKTIGLIGGLTWLSMMDYYRLLKKMINEDPVEYRQLKSFYTP